MGSRLREIGLGVVAAIYALLLAAFLAGWHADLLKAPVTIAGVVLAAMIPELLSTKKLIWRFLLLLVPLAGVATVQYIDARNSAAEAAELSDRLTSLQLRGMRDYIRECETRAQERVVPDPRDALATLSYADQALLRSADNLAYRASVLEAIAQNLPAGNAEGAAARQQAARMRAQETRYRAGAAFFQQNIFANYPVFREGGATRATEAELTAQLNAAHAALVAFAERQPSAGLFGRMGMVAIARQQPEQALYYFYRALNEDAEFVAAYEQLGYSGWALNQDARVGARYARAGFALLDRLAPLPAQQTERAIELAPDDAKAELRARWTAFQPTWNGWVDNYRNRLALQVAYFSALELDNEAEARQLAEALHAADPDDAEFQDGLGFVLMRFAHNEEDLRRATTLFEAAIVNARGEHATAREAAKHLDQAAAMREQITGGSNSRALELLAQSCR